jgi:hypothetical protein
MLIAQKRKKLTFALPSLWLYDILSIFNESQYMRLMIKIRVRVLPEPHTEEKSL